MFSFFRYTYIRLHSFIDSQTSQTINKKSTKINPNEVKSTEINPNSTFLYRILLVPKVTWPNHHRSNDRSLDVRPLRRPSSRGRSPAPKGGARSRQRSRPKRTWDHQGAMAKGVHWMLLDGNFSGFRGVCFGGKSSNFESYLLMATRTIPGKNPHPVEVRLIVEINPIILRRVSKTSQALVWDF